MYNTIGRTILKLPKSNRVAYISKKEKQWTINNIDLKSGESEMMINILNGSEDLAVTHNGLLIVDKWSDLYHFDSYNHQDDVNIVFVSV